MSNYIEILQHIQEEVRLSVPDYGQYTVIQIQGTEPHPIFYNISRKCPQEKKELIEKTIKHNAALFKLRVTKDDIE